MKVEILNIDYTNYINILGTAHFTQRSIIEAYQAVKNTGTKDLAIELDEKRFRILNKLCFFCLKKASCSSRCEFIKATEALGNIDANIWLIDMSEEDMLYRIQRLNPSISQAQLTYALNIIKDEELPWLWEKGFKNEALKRSIKRLEILQKISPQIWRVLIEERNALMAARLAAIASNIIENDETPNILALMGAAHVEGVKKLLENPILIQLTLKKLDLQYSPPTLIRRIRLQN
ncbi:MAG: TraB/GumN family protein [Candidatus Bathyarchaeia archaeon]